LMTRVFLLSLSCNDLATPYLYTLSLHDALPIFLFVFAASIMGIVTYAFLSDPLLVLALIALSFVIAFALGGAATAAFWPAGREQALTLGVSAGMRNMGLMLAAASGVSDTVWLYIAVAQLPIYLAPWLLYPLVQRILRP